LDVYLWREVETLTNQYKESEGEGAGLGEEKE